MRTFVLMFALVGCANDLDLGEVESEIDVNAFVLPPASATARAEIVYKYDELDPGDLIPRGMLEDAIVYFELNNSRIPKTDYFVVIDFSKFSGKDRFWLVDVNTGKVEAHKVAHGDGSDPDHDGFANSFGNVDGSHKSSLGYYLTGEIYDGTHEHSMRLDGLSKDGSPNGMANTNARSRLIVIHEASYVDDDNTSKQGRSNGCPALDPSIEVAMVDRIYGGSLIYAAKTPLNAPVGRSNGDPGRPADDPNPVEGDPGDEPPAMDDETGGCSTGGSSAGLLLAFAIVGLRRRRR